MGAASTGPRAPSASPTSRSSSWATSSTSSCPRSGAALTEGQAFGTIESVKAVSELFAPLSGTVIEVNTSLKDRPDAVNSAPHDYLDDQVHDRQSRRGRVAARRRRLRSARQVVAPRHDGIIRPPPHRSPPARAARDARDDRRGVARRAHRRSHSRRHPPADAGGAARRRIRVRVPDPARRPSPRATRCCAASSAWATTTPSRRA